MEEPQAMPQAGPVGSKRISDYFQQFRGQFFVGLLFLLATQALSLWVPKLLNRAVDALVARDGQEALAKAGWMVGVAVAAACVRVLSRVWIFNAGRQVEHALRADLFDHLLRQCPAFYDRLPQAQVMSRAVNDLTQVRLLLGPGLLNLTNTSLVYLVVIPILLWTDWVLTLCTLSTLPVLLILGQLFSRRIYPLSSEAQERLGTLSTKVQETIGGTMTVRAYGQEGFEADRFRRLNEAYLEVNISLARLRGLLFPMMGLAGGVGAVILLALSGPRIAAGTMTVGGFVEFNAYLAALTWPTIALGWMISLVQRGRAAMERINQIFEATPSLVDGPVKGALRQLEVRQLNFSYPNAKTPALDNLSFRIEPGEMVVVVGRTGSGKSTLLELIARLRAVPDGSIFWGGVDVNQLALTEVRNKIAYAPQDTFLFSRSLSDNVGFGSQEPTEAMVRRALSDASFEIEVNAFPEGLETMIGERGVTLSGGQRQRTTLARALLTDRPVLLLDDTLSAVDTETESEILDRLLLRRGERTLILATHRLASAARADRILVLEAGRLVEEGTEAELLAKQGVYAAMHRRQRVREALEQGSAA